MTQNGVFARSETTEEEREGSLKILVGDCGATKAFFAHAVLKSGADDEGNNMFYG